MDDFTSVNNFLKLNLYTVILNLAFSMLRIVCIFYIPLPRNQFKGTTLIKHKQVILVSGYQLNELY